MPRGHVLVVDDEPSILNTLKKALSLEGYAVDVAGGVGIAEERLGKRGYDVVLLDVALPDGNGVELLERLRAAGCHRAWHNAPILATLRPCRVAMCWWWTMSRPS